MPQPMTQFFDNKVDSYDQHMKSHITDFSDFYQAVSLPIKITTSSITLLDLGAGTGLELKNILQVVPNAQIVCVDLSSEMLRKLKEKYQQYSSQIKTIQDSYLTLDLGKEKYDYVVSVMSLHHFLPDTKAKLFSKIFQALNKNGLFINGDYVVPPEESQKFIAKFNKIRLDNPSISEGSHHIDIPLSFDVESNLLTQVGFGEVKTYFHRWANIVYSAIKLS